MSMSSFSTEFLQALGSIGTAIAAIAAVGTLWIAARKNKADGRRSYGAAVRRNLIDFRFQLKVWNDNFQDAQYTIVAAVALRDVLEREEVPSPATPAFDEYIKRNGVSLCLEVWNTAMQSTDVNRSRESFMRAASSFEGLMSIVGSTSHLFHALTRQLYSPDSLHDVVNQLAVPQRRLMDEKDRQGIDRLVSHREEVRQFVGLVRDALTMQQKRCIGTIQDVNRFFEGFFREMKSLSDKDIYRLSHVPASIRSDLRKSDTHTGDMNILLSAIKRTVAMDTTDELSGVIADLEREVKHLADPGEVQQLEIS